MENKDKLQYDSCNRIMYHPDFHDMYRKPFTADELCYMAKFIPIDGAPEISLALGRPEASVRNRYTRMLNEGLLEFYRGLDFYI